MGAAVKDRIGDVDSLNIAYVLGNMLNFCASEE
jgi:hypothetical protein